MLHCFGHGRVTDLMHDNARAQVEIVQHFRCCWRDSIHLMGLFGCIACAIILVVVFGLYDVSRVSARWS